MERKYFCKNRRKYDLKIHIVLVTKYRKPLFSDTFSERLKQIVFDIANDNNWVITAMETDKDHIHILLGYDATERVCDIVRKIKQRSTYLLWKKYSTYLKKHYWKSRVLWSDGYFVCSIGEVSSATIKRYIDSQG